LSLFPWQIYSFSFGYHHDSFGIAMLSLVATEWCLCSPAQNLPFALRVFCPPYREALQFHPNSELLLTAGRDKTLAPQCLSNQLKIISKTCSNAQLHMWTTHVHYTYAQCVCMTHASCIKHTTVQTHFAQLLYIRITCTVLTPQKGSTIFCSRCSKVKAVVERILKHTLCLFDFAVQEL
jgi:hypothetical protein